MNKIKKFFAVWVVTVTLAPIIGGLVGGATYGVSMLFTESSSEVPVDLFPADLTPLDANEQPIDRFADVTRSPGADTLPEGATLTRFVVRLDEGFLGSVAIGAFIMLMLALAGYPLLVLLTWSFKTAFGKEA